MSTGMPELGSKISLISKADIRYEGRLFTVDPTECTIALASVRSFGTEERETQYPVPAQNQVYDYILFRGSDIKDIRVINNVPTLPNDPAIMQLSVPPSLGQHQFHSQGYSHPVVGTVMGPGQFGAGYGGTSAIGALTSGMAIAPGARSGPSKPSELIIPGSVPHTDLNPDVEPRRSSEHDFIGGGSRSGTPASHSSRKSPTADQGVQVSGAGKKDDKRISRPIQPPGHRNQPRDRQDSKGEGSHQQQYNVMDSVRNQNRQTQNRPNQGHMNQNNRHQGWGPIQRGQPRTRGPRPRGAPGSGPSGGYRPNHQNHPNHQNYPNHPNHPNQQNSQPTGSKPKSTLKFDNDYDFEQANTQFEEIKNQFEKLKIKDGKPEVNGDSEKKDDSGNETGAGEGEQEDDEQVFYNKAKSFFDNISCEAVERSKGRSQRTDWRAERKLNSETFGVASARRTGYRGRGGFYNNRGGFRMGYRGGYRPPQQGHQGQTHQGQGHQGNRRMQERPTTAPNQQQAQPTDNSNNQRQPSTVPASGTK